MLAIILVNFNNENRTIFYVINELTKIDFPHIIVIVNNQATSESNNKLITDLGAELQSNFEKKPNSNGKIFIIPHPDNLGYAKGINLGAKFALTHFNVDYFLISNSDIKFIDNDIVDRLINKINTLPVVALIGPKIIGLNGESQSPEPYISFWNRYIWMYWLTPFLSKSKKQKIFKLDYSKNAKEGFHYKVMGSFFILKATDFVKCGMMDSNTFLYAEEIILSERIQKLKKKIYYYPSVGVLHEHNQNTSQYFTCYQIQKEQFTSMSYYYMTYKGVSKLSILLGKISLMIYLRLKN